MKCKAEDDYGTICNREMTEQEEKQDGMCSRCADLIWNNYLKPIRTNKPTKPIKFND